MWVINQLYPFICEVASVSVRCTVSFSLFSFLLSLIIYLFAIHSKYLDMNFSPNTNCIVFFCVLFLSVYLLHAANSAL